MRWHRRLAFALTNPLSTSYIYKTPVWGEGELMGVQLYLSAAWVSPDRCSIVSVRICQRGKNPGRVDAADAADDTLHRGGVQFLSGGSARLEPDGSLKSIRLAGSGEPQLTRSTQARFAPAPAHSAGDAQSWTRSKPLVVSTHGGCCLSPVLGDNQPCDTFPRLAAFCRMCEGLPVQPGTSFGRTGCL